jgi:hypothetical protein
MATSRQTTLITAAGTTDSPDRYGCPGVHSVPGRSERFVITREVDDPEVLDALAPHVGVDQQGRPELVGSTPTWVPSLLMDLETLGQFIEAHAHQRGDSVFRMECLPEYAVTSDGDDFHRWAGGAPEPTWSRKQPWLDALAEDRDRGISHRRVRRFGRTLTEYELYSCQWGYALNAPAGEEIRVLRDGEHDVPELLDTEYWIINDGIVVPVLYDALGGFVGGGVLSGERVGEFLADQELAWGAAEPFEQWWSRHSELHRDRLVA